MSIVNVMCPCKTITYMSNVAHKCPGSTAFIWFKNPSGARKDLKEWQTQAYSQCQEDSIIGKQRHQAPHNKHLILSVKHHLKNSMILQTFWVPQRRVKSVQAKKVALKTEKFTIMGHTLHIKACCLLAYANKSLWTHNGLYVIWQYTYSL